MERLKSPYKPEPMMKYIRKKLKKHVDLEASKIQGVVK